MSNTVAGLFSIPGRHVKEGNYDRASVRQTNSGFGPERARDFERFDSSRKPVHASWYGGRREWYDRAGCGGERSRSPNEHRGPDRTDRRSGELRDAWFKNRQLSGNG